MPPPDTEAIAEQVFTALADPSPRDWDGPLDALKDQLDQHARGSA
jgi:hypothetical protein